MKGDKVVIMYYAGKRRTNDNRLGNYFIELKDGKGEELSHTLFVDKNDYALGYAYEVGMLADNKIRMGQCLKAGVMDTELLDEWTKEDALSKATHQERKQEESFARESKKGFENMTLRELKDKCNNNWNFRKVIFYWLMNGGNL